MTYTRSTITFGILLCLGAVVLVAHVIGWTDLSVEQFEDVVKAWGAWGVIGSIGLMIFHSFVPFPAGFLAMANGMVFGPFIGVIVTWVGAMLGAFLAFGLSRILGRPFVERMLSRKNWQAIDSWTGKNVTVLLLLSRFVPVVAFNLVNYAAGLTRATKWTFAWTTAIGILPGTMIMVIMGDQIGDMDWTLWISLLGIIMILTCLFCHKFSFSKGIKCTEFTPVDRADDPEDMKI